MPRRIPTEADMILAHIKQGHAIWGETEFDASEIGFSQSHTFIVTRVKRNSLFPMNPVILWTRIQEDVIVHRVLGSKEKPPELNFETFDKEFTSGS